MAPERGRGGGLKLKVTETILSEMTPGEFSAFCFAIAISHLNTSSKKILTLKEQTTTVADDSLEYFFHCLSEKKRLDISCESSARIHVKYRLIFFER